MTTQITGEFKVCSECGRPAIVCSSCNRLLEETISCSSGEHSCSICS